MSSRVDRAVRSDASAYDRYLQGMNASMKQKVALTAAHLLGQGKIADLGMGSGTGSDALAALYPDLKVVGVDLDPEMVQRAREAFDRPNLSFEIGDVARQVFPDGSLDGIFNSSVLHHVTSYNGYDRELAALALGRQVAQLKEHGVLIVRDFVAPDDRAVWLDVRAAAPAAGSDEPLEASDAQLLERFGREFRSLSETPGFDYETVESPQGPAVRSGFRRYRLSHRHAIEFILRKDYRRDWANEVREEYCYYTQEQFEAVFRSLGLRILASTPIHNPWIVENRFRGRFYLFDTRGQALDDPATNFVIVGERVAAGEGVDFVEHPSERPVSFLEMLHYRDRQTGSLIDVVRRPNTTIDVLPWFVDRGELFVLCRTSYPRPILRAAARSTDPAGGTGRTSYVAEPLNVLQSDRPLGLTVEDLLQRAIGLSPGQIVEMREGSTYYPSPGGVLEEVRSVHVEVEPLYVHRPLTGLSGFATSGQVQAVAAQQILRAAQVGGLPDARLELNVHQLLDRLGQPPDVWIGTEVELAEATPPAAVASLRELGAMPGRRRFVACHESARFLDVRCSRFDEVSSGGDVVATQHREFVVPSRLSSITAATALLRRVGEQVFLGLDDDDRPVAQAIAGSSRLVVTPAWRLPDSICTRHEMRRWTRQRIAREYGLLCGRTWPLGGPYHPSPGVTPEVVYPLAIEITDERERVCRPLHWVPLEDVMATIWPHPDGHLRILALRAAHALARPR